MPVSRETIALCSKFVDVLTRHGTDPVGTKLFGQLRIGMSSDEVAAIFPDLKFNGQNAYTNNGLLVCGFHGEPKNTLSGFAVHIAPVVDPKSHDYNKQRYEVYDERLTLAFGKGKFGRRMTRDGKTTLTKMWGFSVVDEKAQTMDSLQGWRVKISLVAFRDYNDVLVSFDCFK